MILETQIDGQSFVGMIAGGAANLRRYAQEVNDLNVFPIPDGDTGDNMMMTIEGGANIAVNPHDTLSDAATQVARGMLLGARGNSGVILSQFFAGIADGLQGLAIADVSDLKAAFQKGVQRAYSSVMVPTEGTILTVAREAVEAAEKTPCATIGDFLNCFIEEAKRSLERTPEKLDVLKEAGVVDSGGAGLIYISEGMYGYVTGQEPTEQIVSKMEKTAVNPDLFTEDSVLEFGYCTELLIRLQRCKTDPEAFDINIIRDYLQTVGNSIVAFKTGSIVKLHVHTMKPYKVLEFCQRYGEFLTVKIENMMLQHNGVEEKKQLRANDPIEAADTKKNRRKAAVITVASGEGIRDAFIEFGADEVIFGGQTMNPSAEDFIEAFERVNADNIFVLPNNGNVILAARQAAQLYTHAEVRVIPTHTIGDAYAVLSMLDLEMESADEIEANMNAAMDGVITAEISKSIRDAAMKNLQIHKDDYIGIIGKEILSSNAGCLDTVCETAAQMNLLEKSLLILIQGKSASSELSDEITAKLKSAYPLLEICQTDGKQEVYDYILVAE